MYETGMTDATETTPDRLRPAYERKRVRWDPTINMGHLITMVTSMITSLVFVMASWAAIDKRVTVLEEARLVQRERDTDARDQLREKIDGLKEASKETRESIELLRREVIQRKSQ